MDTTTLEIQLKSKQLPRPVLIFSGPEDFLKERMLQKIVSQLVAPEDQSENIFRYDGSSRDFSAAESQIFSFSFNSSPRIFWLSNFSSLNTAQRKTFLSLVSQNGIPTGTYLIFVVNDAKIAGEIASSFKQLNEKIDFWRPFENQLPAWVKKEAAEIGGKINADAAELLIELTGASLAVLFQELNKLIIAAAGKPVTAVQVKTSVRYLNQDSVFDFLNNLGNKKTKEAVRAIEILVNSGEAPQKIWFMLCRQLREYRLFHDLLNDRPDLFADAAEILRSYGRIAEKTDFKANQEKKNLTSRLQQMAESFPPCLADAVSLKNPAKSRNLYMAMNFNRSELVKAWPEIVKTDLLLKSGVPDPCATLQAFTIKLLSGALAS